MFYVFDGHTERLNLGHSLSCGLDQRQPGSQLSEGLVGVLHPGSLSVAGSLFVLFSLLSVLEPGQTITTISIRQSDTL